MFVPSDRFTCRPVCVRQPVEMGTAKYPMDRGGGDTQPVGQLYRSFA